MTTNQSTGGYQIVRCTSAPSTTGEASDGMVTLQQDLQGMRDDLLALRQQTTEFIDYARENYIRYSHFVSLEQKITIAPLGLDDAAAQAYTYQTEADYQPHNAEGHPCYGDVQAFANGFRDLPIPEGMEVYLHLMVEVTGEGNSSFHNTQVNFLRYCTGCYGYHDYQHPELPFVFLNTKKQATFEVNGRDWAGHDAYRDRNIFMIANYQRFNRDFWSKLRILNLGQQTLEVFGIGVEVRHGPAVASLPDEPVCGK